MRNIFLYIAIASYVISEGYEMVNHIFLGSDIMLVTLSAVSLVFVLGCTYGMIKGVRLFKWGVAIYLLLCGICMLPWFVSPAITSLAKRFALGFLGILWIAASLWIIKYYQPRKKKNELPVV